MSRGSSLLLTHVSVKSGIPEECWHFVAGRDGNSEAFYSGFLSVEAIRQGRKPLVDCYKEQTEKTIMMTLRQFSAEPSTIPTITSWYLADLSKAQSNRREP